MDTTNKQCKKTCIISFLAVYIFTMAYGFVVHGMLLKGDYEATASLWRPEADMQQLAWVCWVLHAVMAAAIVCIYKKFRKGLAACNAEAGSSGCPIKSGGICFGLKLGLLLGALQAMHYIPLPIPGELAVKWFFSEFFLGLGIGAILGMVCKTGSGEACGSKVA